MMTWPELINTHWYDQKILNEIHYLICLDHNMTSVCSCSEVCVRCSGSVVRCNKDCGEVQEDYSGASKHRTL